MTFQYKFEDFGLKIHEYLNGFKLHINSNVEKPF